MTCPLCNISDYIYRDDICTIIEDNDDIILIFNRHTMDISTSMMIHAYNKCNEIFKDKFMLVNTRANRYMSHKSWEIWLRNHDKKE